MAGLGGDADDLRHALPSPHAGPSYRTVGKSESFNSQACTPADEVLYDAGS
jgi:hypothetical protein